MYLIKPAREKFFPGRGFVFIFQAILLICIRNWFDWATSLWYWTAFRFLGFNGFPNGVSDFLYFKLGLHLTEYFICFILYFVCKKLGEIKNQKEVCVDKKPKLSKQKSCICNTCVCGVCQTWVPVL